MRERGGGGEGEREREKTILHLKTADARHAWRHRHLAVTPARTSSAFLTFATPRHAKRSSRRVGRCR